MEGVPEGAPSFFVSSTMQIWMYPRECQLGDYVFADGSYSDVINKNKTVVGICFYVNPAHKSNRLCVSLNYLTNASWGLYRSTTTWPEGITLIDSPTLNVFDIPTLVNKNAGTADGSITEATYRDVNGDSDGFKIYPDSVAVGELGLTANEVEIAGFKKGDQVPWGLANTLKIIDFRNKILNDSSFRFPVPTKIGTTSEYENLSQCISQVISENGNATKYGDIYHQAASYCHAYEPSVKPTETLKDSLRVHNWFLPSGGEFARIYWYWKQGKDGFEDDNIFKNAIAANILQDFGPTFYHWTSTENGESLALLMIFDGRLAVAGQGRTQKMYVRPIAAF